MHKLGTVYVLRCYSQGDLLGAVWKLVVIIGTWYVHVTADSVGNLAEQTLADAL